MLSVNYRSGIGYGRSFRTAPNTGGRGNAEYQDVLAGGKYLQSRPDVDPERVGIWGLSYGGVLTGAGAGAQLGHLQGRRRPGRRALCGAARSIPTRSRSSRRLSARSTAGSRRCCSCTETTIETWRFSRRPGSCSCLRQRDVYYELIVFPDDTHESMLHSRWLYTLDRMEQFFKKFLGGAPKATTAWGGR